MPVGSSPSERARALRRQREAEEERRRREAAQRAREALRRRQQAAAAKAAPKRAAPTRAAPDRGTVSDRAAADRAIRAGAQRAATREVQQVGFKEASQRAVARSEAVHAKGQRSVVQWTALVKKARAKGVNPIYAGEYDRLERRYGPDVKVEERSGRPIDPLPDLQRRARRAGVKEKYAAEYAQLSREHDLVPVRNGRPYDPDTGNPLVSAVQRSRLYRTTVLGEEPPARPGEFKLTPTYTSGWGRRAGTSALAKDVRDFSAGLLPGAISGFAHPGRALEQGFDQYAHTYGPALRGDFGTTRRRIAEHPLGPILDAAAVATFGTTSVARVLAGTRALAARQGAMAAAREVFGRKATPFRYLQTPESLLDPDSPGIQLRSSRNPIVRAAERRRDRAALRRDQKLDALRAAGVEPGRVASAMEHFGARARAGRQMSEASDTRAGRAVSTLEEPLRAARGLKPAEEVAYDVIGDYGVEAAEAILLEIQMRSDKMLTDAALSREGSTPLMTRQERTAQLNQIKVLRDAIEHVRDPSPALQRAVAELGHGVGAQTEARKIAMGQLTEETAAEHLAQPYRIVTGAASRPRPGEQLPLEEAPRPIRTETIERPRTVADLEARRNELQGIYDEVMTKAEAQYFGAEGKLNKAERAEQARRNRLNAKARRQREGLKKRYIKEQRKSELEFELANNPEAHRVAEIKRDLRRGYEEVRGGGVSGGWGEIQPTVKDERRAELVKIFEGALEAAAGRGDEAAMQFIRVQDELHDLTRRLTPEFMDEPDLSGLDPLVVEQRPIFAPEPEPPPDPGLLPAPEGAFYRPRIAAEAPRSLFAVGKGLGKPRRLVKQSRHILFQQGRFRRGTKLTIEDAARTIRHAMRLVDFEEIRPFTRELDFEASAKGLLPGFRYFNPEGVRVPREWRDADELTALSPQEVLAELRATDESMMAQAFPDERHFDPRTLPEEERGRVRQVPDTFAEAFQRRSLRISPNDGLDKTFMRIIDDVNAITKTGTIYLKPTYIPFNVAGNVMFLAIQQGLWTPLNLLKAWHKTGAMEMLGGFDLVTLRRLDHEVGTGGTMALAGPPTGTLPGRVSQRIAEFESNIADRIPRRAAILHELGRRGYKTDEQVNKLLDSTDPGEQAHLFQASRDAEEAMVRFRGLGPRERQVITRLIFVYPWIKGATRYAGRLVLDHPIKADLLAHVGQQGTEDLERVLGKLQSYMKAKSLVPVGGKGSKLGVETQKVLDLTGMSPSTTGTEVVSDLMAFMGMTGEERPPAPAGYATPLAGAALEAATRFDPFRGRPYPADMAAIPNPLDPSTVLNNIFVRSLGGSQPLVRLLAPWEEGSLTNRAPEITSLDPNPTRQPNWLPGGPLEPLLRFGLAGAYGRDLNLTAQHAKAAEDANKLTGYARVHAREVAEFVGDARRARLLRPGQPLPPRVVADLRLEREVGLRKEAALDKLRETQPGRRGFAEGEKWRGLQLWADVLAERRSPLVYEVQEAVDAVKSGAMTYRTGRAYIRATAMPSYSTFNAEVTGNLDYLVGQ